MSGRALLALCATAVLLGGYVALFEGSGPRPGATERRVLPGMPRAQVRRIRIARAAGHTVELVRQADVWTLRGGSEPRADRQLVERLLSTLEFLEPLRTLPAQTNRRRLGLAPPQVVLEVTAGGGVHRLELGREDPARHGAYLAHGEEIVVVDRELLEMAQLAPASWRDRDLVPFEERSIAAVRIDGVELVAEDGVWFVAAADGETGRVRADPRQVGRLVAGLTGLRATRFLGRDPGAGTRISIVERPPSSKTVHIDLAGACPGRPAERAAKAGSVSVCIAREDLVPILVRREDLMDRRLTHLREPELRGIRIEGRGTAALELRRDGGRWLVSRGPGTTEEADDTAIRTWVDTVARTEAAALDALQGEASPPYRIRVKLTPEEGTAQTLSWLVSAPVAGAAAVRRGDEAVTLRLDAGQARALFDLPALHFHGRDVLRIDRELVSRVETVRGAEKEVVLRRPAGEWAVEQPVRARADQEHMARLLAKLGRLRARRVLPGAPPAGRAFGVHVTLERDRMAPGDAGRAAERRSLQVMAHGDGPCHARTADSRWYEMDAVTCGLLLRRRAGTRCFRFGASLLRGIELQRAGQWRLAAHKRAGGWVAADAALPSDDVARLVRLLRRLGGPVVSYGERGLRGPAQLTVRVDLERSGAQTCRVDARGRAACSGQKVTRMVEREALEQLERLGESLVRARATRGR